MLLIAIAIVIVNVNAFRLNDIEDIATRTIRLALHFNEVFNVRTYKKGFFVNAEPTSSVLFDDRPEVEKDTEVFLVNNPKNTSILLPIKQNKHIKTSKFEKAIAILFKIERIS